MEERGIVASKSFHLLVLTRKKIGEKDVEVVEAKKVGFHKFTSSFSSTYPPNMEERKSKTKH